MNTEEIMTPILPTTTRHPDVSFFANGKIDITSRIARQLSLADGDVIDVCRHSSGECCLYVRYRSGEVIGRHVGVAHRTRSSALNFRAYSVSLCNAIFALSEQSSPARFTCGEPLEVNGEPIIPIIIQKPL